MKRPQGVSKLRGLVVPAFHPSSSTSDELLTTNLQYIVMFEESDAKLDIPSFIYPFIYNNGLNISRCQTLPA